MPLRQPAESDSGRRGFVTHASASGDVRTMAAPAGVRQPFTGVANVGILIGRGID